MSKALSAIAYAKRNRMSRIMPLLLCLAFLLSACDTYNDYNRKRFMEDFKQGCLYEADSSTPAKYNEMACECMAEMSAEVFSDDEIAILVRGGNPGASEEHFKTYNKMKSFEEFSRTDESFHKAFKQCFEQKLKASESET